MKKLLFVVLAIVPLCSWAQNRKISEMNAANAVSPAMYVPVVDPNEASPANQNKRLSISLLDGRYATKSSLTANTLLFWDGNNLVSIPDGTAGQALITNGAGAYTFGNASISFGTDNQIPFMNSGGNGFEYSGNFTFDGSILSLTGTGNVLGQFNVDNIRIDGNQIYNSLSGAYLLLQTTTNSHVTAVPSGNGRFIVTAGTSSQANSNQIILGTTNTTTINASAPAAGRTYTIPDAGANANFVLSVNNVLAVSNGTAPSSSPANMVQLYAEDVSASSELKVRDEACNITTLSPHNFSLIPEGPGEEMAWAFYSKRGEKEINVDMLRLARGVEKVTGEKYVYTATGGVATELIK